MRRQVKTPLWRRVFLCDSSHTAVDDVIIRQSKTAEKRGRTQQKVVAHCENPYAKVFYQKTIRPACAFRCLRARTPRALEDASGAGEGGRRSALGRGRGRSRARQRPLESATRQRVAWKHNMLFLAQFGPFCMEHHQASLHGPTRSTASLEHNEGADVAHDLTELQWS